MNNEDVKKWLEILIQNYIYDDVEDELMEMRDIIYNALSERSSFEEICKTSSEYKDDLEYHGCIECKYINDDGCEFICDLTGEEVASFYAACDNFEISENE